MEKGILGRKEGMTQVFTVKGKLIPVTVISVEPNIVTQIKTKETDGYEAIQLGFDTKREKLSNKPEMGHVKKANTTPKRFLKEIRGVYVADYQLGQELKADVFQAGDIVDATGVSKGKGYQGNIKRHNQKRGPMSHGSQYHRGVGTLGSRLPMHVLKGKNMPGHMGHETITIQNLEVVAIDLEKNIILIKGNVPGPKKSLVIIKAANKKADKKANVEELIIYQDADSTVQNENVENEVVNEEVVSTENNEEALKEDEQKEETSPNEVTE
jgi:large subunit ribosomal protein L3